MCKCNTADQLGTMPPLEFPVDSRKTEDTVTIYTNGSGKPLLIEFHSRDGELGTSEYLNLVSQH